MSHLKKKLKYEDAYIKPIQVDNNRNTNSNLHSNLSGMFFVDFFERFLNKNNDVDVKKKGSMKKAFFFYYF